MPTFSDVHKLFTPAKKGTAEIRIDEPSQLVRMRAAMDGQPLTAAKFVRLLVNGSVMMTDADFEKRTNVGPISSAHGDALVAGLGIGLILAGLVARCRSVTVIENNADVIALVAKRFKKVRVIHADIFEWQPPKQAQFDFIYFDIWPEINPDELKQARALHRKFRKHLKPGGYMESWNRLALRALGRRRTR